MVSNVLDTRMHWNWYWDSIELFVICLETRGVGESQINKNISQVIQ